MKKIIFQFGFVLTLLFVAVSCGDSTGDLVGLPPNSGQTGQIFKSLKKVTTEQGGTSFDTHYLYTAGKLTSVSTSNNSIAYTIEYNGSQISKITKVANQGGSSEVSVSNLTYNGNTLTEVNGTRTEAGTQTATFKTTFTYAGGLPSQVKTQMFAPGTTVVLGTLTSDLQYAGNNVASWVYKIQTVSSPPVVIPDIVITTNFSNYDSNPNPFHTLPLAFTLANLNFDIEGGASTGISLNNYKTVSVVTSSGTQSATMTYTYDTDNYPVKFDSSNAVLKFEYN